MDSMVNSIIVKIQKHLYAVYGGECAALSQTVLTVQENVKNLPYGQKKLVALSSAQDIIAKYGNK